MRDILNIALEAHNHERNHHRRYEVSVERDLLGDWLVTIRFGRVGGGIQERRFGCSGIEAARRIVHEHLFRRLSAPSRIGCAYRVRSLATALAGLGDWIPQGLMLGCGAPPP